MTERRASRGWIRLATIGVSCALLTACAGPALPEATPVTVDASPAPTVADPPPPTTTAPSTEDSPMDTTTIVITIAGTAIRGHLRDNAATASLLSRLPLDLAFADLGGQEKIARLPAALSLEGMPSGSDAEVGTIGYYAPNQSLVLYYEPVGYYDGIIPIGTFDDVEFVRDTPPSTGTVRLE